MVLLFVHQNSPRLHYITEEVFSRRLGFAVSITLDINEFLSSTVTHKIAYTPTPIELDDNNSMVWVFCDGLLQENFVRPLGENLTTKTYAIEPINALGSLSFNTLFGLFPADQSSELASGDPKTATNGGHSFIDLASKHIPFDLFATIFWSISRYEEVQWGISQAVQKQKGALQPDEHGRYTATQSLLFQSGVLERPFVDELVWFLGALLNRKPLHQYSIVPTADIDMALRYGGRSISTQMGSIIRDLITTPHLIFERLRVLLGRKDPYAMDNGTIQLLQKHEKLRADKGPKMFVLASNQRTSRNKQIHRHAYVQEFERLKNSMALSNEWVGIHPSWQEKTNALHNLTEWKNEMEVVEMLIGEKPKHSRFHYIHLHVPHSYQLLTQLGIESDWSMGYPEAIGFRAGTSVPFIWYDIVLDQTSKITVVPFCIMDVTCRNYKNLSPQESINIGLSIKSKVQLMGGTFCFIFHNESVSESHPWKGWKNVIESWAEPTKSNNPS